MSALIVRIRVWLVQIGFTLGGIRPPGRHVLLASAHADRIGGNLAFIRDELARSHPGVRVKIIAHRAEPGWRGRLRGAVAAIRAGFALARARVIVIDDYFFPIYVTRPRSGATIIQTWHASGAFKKFGRSVGDRSFGAGEALTSRVRIHSNYDVCLVGSARAAPHYADAFGLPIERFVSHLGIPRTDLFFDHDARQEAIRTIRTRYDLPAGRRLILWAPTFRGDRVTDARDPEALDLEVLAQELGEDHVLLLRLHPFIRSRPRIRDEIAGFVRDVSDHPDINELMLVADVLVTDYSSAIFEYSLLERPMAFFAPDLDAYERERGFYFDYRTGVPGPVFESSEALAGWLRNGAFDVEGVRRFRDASFDVADGRASGRVVEQLILPTSAPSGHSGRRAGAAHSRTAGPSSSGEPSLAS